MAEENELLQAQLSSQPIRVALVVPSLARGGAQTQVIDLVNSLPKSEFDLHLFTFERNLDQKERLHREGLRFYSVPRRYKFDLRPARELAKVIDSCGIQVLHCTLQIALFQAAFARAFSISKPILVDALHTTVNRNAKDEVLDQTIYRILMRACDRIICVCEAQRSHWEKKFSYMRGMTTVIYNGVDTQRFSPKVREELRSSARDQFNIGPNDFCIAYVAGFRPEKGHDLLVKAFEKVRDRYPNAVLIFAGDGPLRQDVERQTESLGISSATRFLGNMADVRPVLAAADLTAIASTRVETFSIAMLESMAMGVPLVAADIGGTREAIIDGVNGYLFPVGDIAALTESLQKAAGDPSRTATLGEYARQTVRERFGLETMTQQSAQLLRELTHRDIARSAT